jgi:hypothetical protein
MPMGDTFVPVLVAYAALQVIEWSPPGSGDYLTRFEKHRDQIERIANGKHQGGQVEGDGSIIVQRHDVRAGR